MNSIELNKLRASIRRLDANLKDCGYIDVHKMRKKIKIKLYCEKNNIEPPFSSKINEWLIEKFNQPQNTLSREVKIESKKAKKIKQKARRKAYIDYLKSTEWKNLRLRIFNTRGRICEKCGKSKVELHLHHLTYKRIFKEADEDLMILCKVCHKNVHKKRKKNK